MVFLPDRCLRERVKWLKLGTKNVNWFTKLRKGRTEHMSQDTRKKSGQPRNGPSGFVSDIPNAPPGVLNPKELLVT